MNSISIYKHGDKVYHKADEAQDPRIVTGIVLRPNNEVTYLVTTKDHEVECYDMELTKEKSYV
ncbi:hypothetical protein ACFSTE_15835 [Aquimarina hainanensis]|uniref:Uncharacterized protein n=1 Tax=Aquimarina hainanensis TaxID=1578017 RepID=A0ABW5NBE3_9FLAO